jgi:hypothetical protein
MTRKSRRINSAKSTSANQARLRQLGILNGKLNLPDDLDAPLAEDVLATFEEEWSSEADKRGYREL